MNSKNHHHPQQRGTVLIIALLIVTVMTGLAVNFSGDFQLSLARAEQRFYNGQIQQYWYGLESVAMRGLTEDKDQDIEDAGANANYDHHKEEWATIRVEAPIEGGFAGASLEDAQSRFNLNMLSGRVEKPGSEFEKRYTPEQKQFIRLLQTIPGDLISSNEAEEVAQAVIDWIDPDNNVTGTGGAENDYYQSQDTPYRAANRAFVSVSELRLVRGVTEEIYEFLEDKVIALPDSRAGININTAIPEIFRTINLDDTPEPLSTSDGELLGSNIPVRDEGETKTEFSPLEQQQQAIDEGFQSIADFTDSDDFQGIFGTNKDLWPPTKQFQTGSSYFLMKSEIEIAGVKRRAYSLLKRDKDDSGQVRIRVVRRSSEPVF